jgi:hypothetical protein
VRFSNAGITVENGLNRKVHLAMLDDFEVGKLVAHVDKCNDAISRLSKSVIELETRIEKLDNQLAKGRGYFAGVLFTIGIVGSLFAFDWGKLGE